ncbi:MAG: NfeD family protein [Chloroflexota bacterium]|jgi:membrane protein implicated in regulation of membrane protease activity|nr:NfeD family protein [Chloroflexota bacterium]
MTEQVLVAAIVAVVAILVIAGLFRVAQRRRGSDTSFGAGGTTEIPIGTRGTSKTLVSSSGVVYAAGEEWTARTADGSAILPGQRIRVTSSDGLMLIVEPEPADASVGE